MQHTKNAPVNEQQVMVNKRRGRVNRSIPWTKKYQDAVPEEWAF